MNKVRKQRKLQRREKAGWKRPKRNRENKAPTKYGGTYVDGAITSNAKKEAGTLWIEVRWLDKKGRVVAHDLQDVSHLAPGETLPFRGHTDTSPEIVRYEVTIKSVYH